MSVLVDTEYSHSKVAASALTALLIDPSTEKFLKECSSAISAMSHFVSILNTYLLEPR